jgi:glycosyltransferase 2 family protein
MPNRTVDTRPPAGSADPPAAAWPGIDSGARDDGWRRIAFGWPVKAALSSGLVLYFLAHLDWGGVAQTLLAADPRYVATAFAVFALAPLLAAERWRCASLASGVSLARRFFVPATYAALFAGQFLPSGIGMDALRMVALWRQRVPFRSALQTIAVDRICGVTAILALAYVGMPFVLDLLPSAAATPIAAVTALMVAAGGALLFVDRLPLPAVLRRGWLGHALSLISGIRGAVGTLPAAVALLFSIAIHVLGVFGVMLLAQAFGYGLRFLDLLTVTALAILAGMLPISLNGWGVREGAMILGMSLLAVPRDVALMISVLFGACGALCSLPGSVSWYHLRHAPPPADQSARAA